MKDNQQAWNALVKELVVANHQHRQSLAARLNDALNAKIQKMEQGTLEDKKKICELVNNTLEPLGLAVQCPNTKLPAKLKATSGSYIGVGRFYFEVYIDGKQKKSTYSDTIPALQLMDAYPPKKLSTHFQDMVGPKASRGGRQLA